MIDSATPFTDDEVEAVKASYPGQHIHVVRRLVATVEQTRRERDAAYACIRRYDEGWMTSIGRAGGEWVRSSPYEYSDGETSESRHDIDFEPMSQAEVDAIRRARAVPGAEEDQ